MAKELSATRNNCCRWNGRLFASKSIDAKFFLAVTKISSSFGSITIVMQLLFNKIEFDWVTKANQFLYSVAAENRIWTKLVSGKNCIWFWKQN